MAMPDTSYQPGMFRGILAGANLHTLVYLSMPALPASTAHAAHLPTPVLQACLRLAPRFAAPSCHEPCAAVPSSSEEI